MPTYTVTYRPDGWKTLPTPAGLTPEAVQRITQALPLAADGLPRRLVCELRRVGTRPPLLIEARLECATRDRRGGLTWTTERLLTRLDLVLQPADPTPQLRSTDDNA